jgi:diguanylate cyclase (GGDEF)-like protein/PAS domain S-box-containing protein
MMQESAPNQSEGPEPPTGLDHRGRAKRESLILSAVVLLAVGVGILGAAGNWGLLGLAPAGVLAVLMGFAYYRARLRTLTDAQGAIESIEVAKLAAEILAEERRRLSAVIEATGVGTWEWNTTTNLIVVNDRWAAILGYRSEQLSPLTRSKWFSLVHPEDLSAVIQAVAAGVASSEVFFSNEFRMKHAEDRWVWILSRGRVMECDEQGNVLQIAGIVLDVTARKAMESALAEAALRDKLTGLPNRALFMERLERAVARVRAGEQPRFAVLFLDFDRFKLINDTLGHKAGDELLRQMAMRLHGVLRLDGGGEDDSMIGRFGGDEFLVLVNNLRRGDDAMGIAERLLDSLTPVFSIFGSEVHSTASIGIVTSDQCVGSAEEIVRNADVAMYEAKRSGRACTVVFTEAMHARLTRHMAIETSLRRAIGTAELYLEYQPIVDLNSGRKVSVEALVRWNHPTLGPISPNEFIPIAEESGLIAIVGQWVLEEACRAMVKWRQTDPRRAPDTISVNLSRAEIALGNRLLVHIKNRLESIGLPPECLQLEVTEREVMRNPESAHKLLLDFRRLGVRLAMDDFGTGTSSLSLLREYSFDTIKIDRSFLQDLTTSRDVLAVMHATINLIENLGMASLAEGVEDSAQVAVLQSLGCRYAQGYFFSRPVAAERLLEAMA